MSDTIGIKVDFPDYSGSEKIDLKSTTVAALRAIVQGKSGVQEVNRYSNQKSVNKMLINLICMYYKNIILLYIYIYITCDILCCCVVLWQRFEQYQCRAVAVGEDVIALEEEEDLLAEAGVKSGVVLMFLAPLELKPSRGKTVSIYSPSLPLSSRFTSYQSSYSSSWQMLCLESWADRWAEGREERCRIRLREVLQIQSQQLFCQTQRREKSWTKRIMYGIYLC